MTRTDVVTRSLRLGRVINGVRACSIICAFAMALVSACALHAQVATGLPPYGSFSGGPDVVNNSNLDAHLSFPVLQKAGVGIPFSYILSYDTSVWSPDNPNGGLMWTWLGGWSTQATTGWTTFDAIQALCPGVRPTCYTFGNCTFVNEYNRWKYFDRMNTEHDLQSSVTVYDYSACSQQGSGPYTATATTTDQLYSVTVNASPEATTAVDVHGFTFNMSLGTTTDSNGNSVTGSTDTLGMTVLSETESGSLTNPPITATYTYTNAQGQPESVKVISQPQVVRTSFGCSGVTEFGPTTLALVSEIDLPDGTKYTFSYEQTPGYSNDVTGRLKQLNLPTGGYVAYAYSGGSNGINCNDGSTPTLTRTVNDNNGNSSTWTYVHSENGSAWTTDITAPADPQGNQAYSVIQSQTGFETERDIYTKQGGTLLETIYTCYNGASFPCNNTTVSVPITQQAITTSIGGLESQVNTDYNAYNMPTEVDLYDWGSGKVGSLLRKTTTAYDTSLGSIEDRPLTVTTYDGSGTQVAQTAYTWDSKGNKQSVSSGGLSRSFTYNANGTVNVVTDTNDAQTTYHYNGAGGCDNAFPTSISEPLGFSKSMTWNCTGGVETSVTDENGQTVSTAYSDPYFWRFTSSTDQEGNQKNFTYGINPPSLESSLPFNSNNSTVDVLTTLDGLGRTLVTQRRNSPGSSTFDSVETNYDSLGRPYQSTVPYSGTAGQTDNSAPKTTTTYDALGRTVQILDGGGGTVGLSYMANDVLQTIGPKVGSENLKERQSEYNGIGQLTSVCEVTSVTGSGPCAQTTSATGYWTKYTYDGIGDLTKVSQNAQSSQVQSRNYAYDSLGRMTSETNPETGNGNPGTTYYFYDSDPGTKGGANCSGTYDGDLVKKLDNAGNVICYTYNALHQVLSITYPYGPNSGNTPSKYFVYGPASGSVTVDGVAMANAKGRLAEAYTCVSSCSSKVTDEGFSYTPRGEVAAVYESTPHSSGYFWVTQSYWANGAPELETNNLSGFPNPTYGVDGEGRINTVSTNFGQNPVTGTSYNSASEATQVNLGSSDTDVFSYDPNTFRMTQYQYNVNGKSVTGALTWNANGTLGELNISDAFNAANTQTCTYSHDDLGRIASGNCGSGWSQTFSYDAFGNLTKTGSGQFQPGYNWQTNQMSSGASYDGIGDVLSDSLHSYAWNSLGRATTIDSVSVTYDANGRMVEQNKNGTYTEIVYDSLGNKLALMNTTSTVVKGLVLLPGGETAVYNASGLQYYRHPDWLGSARFSSTPSRAMYNDLAFAPFGEPYAEAGTTGVTDISFAGNNEDTTTNLYDAQFREYGIQGRWPSPDPAGVGSADPANPQSWNRYAYVSNEPMSATDATGLCPLLIAGIGESEYDANGNKTAAATALEGLASQIGANVAFPYGSSLAAGALSVQGQALQTNNTAAQVTNEAFAASDGGWDDPVEVAAFSGGAQSASNAIGSGNYDVGNVDYLEPGLGLFSGPLATGLGQTVVFRGHGLVEGFLGMLSKPQPGMILESVDCGHSLTCMIGGTGDIKAQIEDDLTLDPGYQPCANPTVFTPKGSHPLGGGGGGGGGNSTGGGSGSIVWCWYLQLPNGELIFLGGCTDKPSASY